MSHGPFDTCINITLPFVVLLALFDGANGGALLVPWDSLGLVVNEGVASTVKLLYEKFRITIKKTKAKRT